MTIMSRIGIHAGPCAESESRPMFDRFLLLTIFLACSMIAGLADRASAGPPDPAMKLIFQENFDTIDLGTDSYGAHRWHFLNSRGTHVSPDLLTLSEGVAKLVTPKDERWGVNTSLSTLPEWRESGTATAPLFNQGYFEARIRFDLKPNHWPAFWLFSETGLLHATGRIPNTVEDAWCEIDIMEGIDRTSYGGTVHDWKSGPSPHNIANSNAHIRLPFGSSMEGWNEYGMLWNSETISWYFNGKKMISIKTPEICKKAELFLIVGAQKHGGAEDQTTEVDWIRVYK